MPVFFSKNLKANGLEEYHLRYLLQSRNTLTAFSSVLDSCIGAQTSLSSDIGAPDCYTAGYVLPFALSRFRTPIVKF